MRNGSGADAALIGIIPSTWAEAVRIKLIGRALKIRTAQFILSPRCLIVNKCVVPAFSLSLGLVGIVASVDANAQGASSYHSASHYECSQSGASKVAGAYNITIDFGEKIQQRLVDERSEILPKDTARDRGPTRRADRERSFGVAEGEILRQFLRERLEIQFKKLRVDPAAVKIQATIIDAQPNLLTDEQQRQDLFISFFGTSRVGGASVEGIVFDVSGNLVAEHSFAFWPSPLESIADDVAIWGDAQEVLDRFARKIARIYVRARQIGRANPNCLMN